MLRVMFHVAFIDVGWALEIARPKTEVMSFMKAISIGVWQVLLPS